MRAEAIPLSNSPSFGRPPTPDSASSSHAPSLSPTTRIRSLRLILYDVHERRDRLGDLVQRLRPEALA